MSKTVLFIMSTGHSGSTLLELILSSHTRVFGLGELSKLSNKIDSPYSDFTRLCSICENDCVFWNHRVSFQVLQRYFSRKHKYSSISRYISRFHKSVYQHFFEWSGSEMLIDSSKKVGWIQRQLSPSYHWGKIFPKLLYLTRDGRAVVNSILRKYPGKNTEQVSLEWKKNIEKMNDFYQVFPYHKRTVSYEDLADHPSETSQSLCRFLQIEFEPEMLCYWKHDHHSCDGNLGTRSLIYKYRSQFGVDLEEVWDRYIEEFKGRHGEYYDKSGLAIKLDLRWKKELTAEKLQVFEKVAGETNKPFVYSG